jgi:signal transduction histidine kinase
MLYQAGYRSRINLPLRVGAQVIGALNLAWPQPAGYSRVNLSLLDQVANAVALAVERNRLLDETRRRDTILEALAYAGEKLLAPGDPDVILSDVLAHLGQATGVSRVYIFQNHLAPDGTLLTSQRYEWTAVGQTPQIDNPALQNVPALEAGFERWMETSGVGRPLYGLVRDFPFAERAILESQDIISIVVVPIFSDGAWWGFLGFDDCERERTWSAAEIEALRSVAGALGAAFARQRSEAAEREQRALAEALRDTAAALTSTLDFDEVLDRILANVGQVVPCEAANVMLIEDGVARIVCCQGYAGRGAEAAILALRLPLAETPNLRAMAETGLPLAISDTGSHADWVAVPASRWIRSYLGAPIRVKGQTIGFLNLDSATPGFFTPVQAERLRAFADQAGVAIENARLYEESQRRLQETRALLEISRNVISTLDLDAVLHRIIEAAIAAIGPAEKGTLHLFDAERGELVIRASVGFSPETLAAACFKPDERYTGWVFTHQQPLNIGNVKADPRTKPIELPEVHEEKSALCVPLVVRNRVIGTLSLDNVTRYDAFTAGHLDLLTIFANQAAVAVENARLHDEVRRHAAGLERRVAERTAELQAANERLKELDRLKSQFVSNVSHELRTPLANIKTILFLLDKGRPEKREYYMTTLERESDLLQHIIEDLLQLSLLDLDKSQFTLLPVDLNALLSTLAADRAPLIADRGLTLRTDLAPELPLVLADAKALTQVASNLLTNAINYTPAGGVITMRTAVQWARSEDRPGPDEAWVALSVSDTGPGISPEDRAHLFERFYRGEAARASQTPGTGLGLAICRELVERHGGRITLETAVGRGSTFTVWLKTAEKRG